MTSRFDDVDLDALRRRRTVKWSLYGPGVMAAWVAEMDFDVAPPIRAALLEGIDREDFGYVVADTSELTTACSEFFATSYGWNVPPARIFLVADVLSGLAGALSEFVPAKRPIALLTPAYPPLYDVVELAGRRVIPVPLGDDGGAPVIDIDAVDRAFRDGAGGLLLCNPQNPTGRAFTADEMTGLATVVERHGGRVIADEVHAPLVYADRRHIPYSSVSEVAAEHAVTVTSASKAWNVAGLKCAQVVTTNHADAAHWRRLPVFAVAGPTPLGVAASTAAYRDGTPWLQELLAYLDGNRRRLGELIDQELPGVRFSAPEATFLAWLDCTALGLQDPARFFLDAARVAVSDGPPFGIGAEQHIRFNFATSRSLVERMIGSMGSALRTRRRLDGE